MQIRSFLEARNAATNWLHAHGGGRHRKRRPDRAGWRLDESGFFQSAYEDWIEPHWCVRYWHVDEAECSGVLRVHEDGRICAGPALFVGCLGLFPAGMFRIEPDGITPVESGYSKHPEDMFWGGHDPRYPGWIREGWLATGDGDMNAIEQIG